MSDASQFRGRVSRVVFTSTGSTTVPAWAQIAELWGCPPGGGGAGGKNNVTDTPQVGGTSGDAALGMVMRVTPGETINVTMGAAGTAGAAGASGGDAGDLVIAAATTGWTINLRGGRGGVHNNNLYGAYTLAPGLGNSGAAISGQYLSAAQYPWVAGPLSPGRPAIAKDNSAAAFASERDGMSWPGYLAGTRGASASNLYGGGGGAASPFGPGGAGGAANASGNGSPGASPASGYGGGGGAGGTGSTGGAAGAAGAPGYLMIVFKG